MKDSAGQQLDPWPTTRWTLIGLMADANAQPPTEHQIGVFLADYLAPLKAYLIRRRGLSTPDAEDVLQEFILQRMLSLELARHVDQSRGRFRTFLLTSLDNFLSNQRRYDRAQKRAPGSGIKPLDDTMDTPVRGVPAADDLFEIEWARMVVRQAVTLVKEHCEKTGRPEIWLAFEARVIGPILDNTPPVGNDELAHRLGMSSAQQVANSVVTAKRIYQRAMHGVIMKYARDKTEVEAELADLRAILSRSRP